MCYIGINKSEQTPIIAKKDIIVVKRLWKKNSKYNSEYKHFNYTREIIPDSIKLVPKTEGYNYQYSLFICEGYHSWDKDLFKNPFNDFKKIKVGSNTLCYCLFMIPKGTKYYKNECNEIVSELIVFIGEI